MQTGNSSNTLEIVQQIVISLIWGKNRQISRPIPTPPHTQTNQQTKKKAIILFSLCNIEAFNTKLTLVLNEVDRMLLYRSNTAVKMKHAR